VILVTNDNKNATDVGRIAMASTPACECRNLGCEAQPSPRPASSPMEMAKVKRTAIATLRRIM
jgi:hypothetical protein